LTFDGPESVDVEPILCPDRIPMFFVDLSGQKDTVRILRDLQTSYPVSGDLKRALGQDNERIIRLAYEALTDGDAETLGSLMQESQAIFDKLVAPHSPAELSSPLLHELLGYEPLTEHVYGGKGVGSQGDGTAQFVARSGSDRDAAMALIKEAFPKMCCFPLTIPNNGRGYAHSVDQGPASPRSPH
jgi:galactokinase